MGVLLENGRGGGYEVGGVGVSGPVPRGVMVASSSSCGGEVPARLEWEAMFITEIKSFVTNILISILKFMNNENKK